jgi:Uncharacterized conserved protein
MAIEKVREYFKKYNIEDRVIELEESSATVATAAKAIGCKEEEIAKTLAFDVDHNSILVVMAGDTKIDNDKYRKYFSAKAKMLGYDEVESLIGHPVGGVCPFAINQGIKVFLDESLKRFEYVYPACGSSHSAIKLNIVELEKYSNYIEWINISKIIEK